jgi:hypothetical protein
MIAAGSFGTRGMLVASRVDDKYAGFLDHSDLSTWLVESWAEAEQRADKLFATPGANWKRALDATRPTLEDHWDQLRETLTTYEKGASKDGKWEAIGRLQTIHENHLQDLQLFQPFLVEKLAETHEKLHSMRRNLEKERARLRSEHQRLRRNQHDITLLRHWMENIDEATRDLWASRQWRIGHAVGELKRRILRRPRERGAQEQLDSQLQKFRAWNKEFERSDGTSPGED